MSIVRTHRAGSAIEDYCRACKTDRMHTVVAADAEGRPLRVVCGYCRSEHNYRGGPRVATETTAAAGTTMSSPAPMSWPAAPSPPRTPDQAAICTAGRAATSAQTAR